MLQITVDHYHHIGIFDSKKLDELIRLVVQLKQQENDHMAALDDKIAALQTEVANNTTVEQSAITLIQGLAQQLAAAIAAAAAAGATTAQLQTLTDLQTTLAANDSALSAAIAANTPAAPAPPSA
jgi:hypothetical protein